MLRLIFILQQLTLPKKATTQQLGESFSTASSRFLRNEAALLRKGNWASFQKVVQEYLTLGHAELVIPTEMCTPTCQTYCLPMHAVHKTTSTSTKLRVVFDGSCSTSSGLSLNDMLEVGPTLYPNLDQILIKFRSYKVAVSADISKMYREVILNKSDRQLHRFVWRSNPDQPLTLYCMNRVTFGVRSSPYVAVRSLQQASVDFGVSESAEQWHILNSFYVDDLLAGADDIEAAKKLYQSLRSILLKAGFDLKKWRSSSTEVLSSIPVDLQETIPQQNMIDQYASSYPKTLGITWDSPKDVMAAQVQLPDHFVSTKRGIVSDTARSFDILGWLAPVMLNMKILFQQLWKLKVDWDESLEEALVRKHKEWRQQLPLLKAVALTRCYFRSEETVSVELHGFSDASEAAFAATIYIRAVYEDGSVSSKLVIAKTRVAPLHTVSVPRLELCGAEMLSELLAIIGNTLQIEKEKFFGWCDSTIALAWLQNDPSNYKTFVANRVASAARNVPQSIWHYVPTDQNPADCASRGITAQELLDHHLWWSGPPWLLQEPIPIPPQPGSHELTEKQELEAKPTAVFTNTIVETIGWEKNYNSYKKLLHVTAYVNRFIQNIKTSIQHQPKKLDHLSVAEVKAAEVILFKRIQARNYDGELKRLASSTSAIIGKGSSLRLVHPYVNEQGLLAVGGRLQKSNLTFLQKNPVILSPSDPVTKLYFSYHHVMLAHSGPTLLLAHTGQEIYVPGAKRLARTVCQNCLVCKKAAPRPYQQKMGQLPAPRITAVLPFVHTGVDFAGPFILRYGNPRKPDTCKVYLCIFVCLSTKLVHIEVVSSASTDAFLAALKRFCCRGGKPSHIYSDNGSNFVGARNELKELYQLLDSTEAKTAIHQCLLERRITWHHIPEKAPHFGGIWEAAVKAAKHFKKNNWSSKIKL